ncbi:hypothetical protein B0T16DRAFT_410728 [Cercophora newfieldiana]|uniref:GS catalytic domain-containing protein n=1 Tax=Cercophora newfieldiana TaxID=92897 RepID=A0AA39YC33_9PEZI|nr:hypothetical protein B0T16DRAFT_410728 [Cercophora newfieldiana]
MADSEQQGGSPLEAFLAMNEHVKFIECIWVDFFGVTRLRKLPVARARHLARSNGHLRLTQVSMASQLEGVSIAELAEPGFDAMCPDWTSVRLIGNDESHAAVICWFLGKSSPGQPKIEHDTDTAASRNRCPRIALARALSFARQTGGVELQVGFELEFYLLDEPYDITAAADDAATSPERDPRVHWSTASSLRTKHGECVESCVEALEACGIAVEQLQAEGSLHQFEISLCPQEAMCAADSLVIAVEVVKRTAMKMGFFATFLPKPFAGRCSSGLHTHISVHGGDATTYPHFLAGMLERLPLLAAFGMPNAMSYSRLGFPALGEWVSWGIENRDAALRQIKPHHWEVRTVDFTANIYLVLATLVAAGVLGIRDREPLRWKECSLSCDRITEAQRLEHGVDTRLPRNLYESGQLLGRGFQGLDEVIGAPILEYYSLLRDADMKRQDGMAGDDILRFLAKEF